MSDNKGKYSEIKECFKEIEEEIVNEDLSSDDPRLKARIVVGKYIDKFTKYFRGTLKKRMSKIT